MRLKNKRTGEIGTLIVDGAYKFVTNLAVEDDECNRLGEYASLAELNEEWCDYEEPENFYIVEQRGTVGSRFRTGDEYEKMFKEIGNYFETKEDAEKAVEKLRAFKRLKDKGFSFNDWDWKSQTINYLLDYTDLTDEQEKEADKDLDLLFCTEENS